GEEDGGAPAGHDGEAAGRDARGLEEVAERGGAGLGEGGVRRRDAHEERDGADVEAAGEAEGVGPERRLDLHAPLAEPVLERVEEPRELDLERLLGRLLERRQHARRDRLGVVREHDVRGRRSGGAIGGRAGDAAAGRRRGGGAVEGEGGLPGLGGLEQQRGEEGQAHEREGADEEDGAARERGPRGNAGRQSRNGSGNKGAARARVRATGGRRQGVFQNETTPDQGAGGGPDAAGAPGYFRRGTATSKGRARLRRPPCPCTARSSSPPRSSRRRPAARPGRGATALPTGAPPRRPPPSSATRRAPRATPTSTRATTPPAWAAPSACSTPPRRPSASAPTGAGPSSATS